MARTGHRSLEGVRSYKRTSSEQMELVSDVLSNGPKRTPPSQPPVVTAHHPSLDKSVPSTSVSEQQNCSMSLHQAAMNTDPTFNFSSCTSVTIQYLCTTDFSSLGIAATNSKSKHLLGYVNIIL